MTMMNMEDFVYDMDEYVDLSEQALYDSIQMKQSRKVLIDKFKPNPTLWSQKFAATVRVAQNRYKRSGLASTFHGLRILIQRQTLYAIEKGEYQTLDGNKVVIDPNDIIISAMGTKYYSSNDIFNIPANINKNNNQNNDTTDKKQESKNNDTKTEIDVINTDCLDAAYSLLSNGYNPCVLNMANAQSPGGGFSSGMGAQEENLCRRSTLITALVNYVKSNKNKLDKDRQWSYPIESYGSIYVPNVTVFRSNEHLGYDFLAKPYKMSMVTAAMFTRPKYDYNFEYAKNIKPEIAKKLKSILRTAYDNGHDSIVLSAWGCGAFKNPPLGQAKLWKEIVFNDKEFKGKFKKITFAIFDDHNAGKQHNPFGNFLPFIQTFDITEKRIKEFVEQMSNVKEVKDNDKDVEMKNENDENGKSGDVFKVLSEIFLKISNIEQSVNIDLDYNVVNATLSNNPCAMSILYCAGFKRSSDGSRLQLEKKRIENAQNVYTQLLDYQTK
eukprot:524233_1